MARLISFNYTYADDDGKVQTVNNVDGTQIHAIAAGFREPSTISLQKYNKLQNNLTRGS